MKAVLLLSGGLDSYTAGAIARADGYELYALTIRYGQVHAARSRRRAAWRTRSASRGISSSTSRCRRSAARRWSATARSRRIARSTRRDIPSTYVPGAQHRVPVAGDGVGRGGRRRGDRDRRQRARLLRLSGLPARVSARVRAARRAGDEGRRRRAAAADPRAAAASCRRRTSSAAVSLSASTTA